MSDLYVPTAVLGKTEHPELDRYRDRKGSWGADDIRVHSRDLTDEVVDDLITAAIATPDAKFQRVAEAIKSARAGKMKPIPSFNAAPELLSSYLRAALIDGWIYKLGTDGHMHPHLVTSISIRDQRGTGDRLLYIDLTADYPFRELNDRQDSTRRDSIVLDKGSVTRKSPDQILLNAGYTRENPELKAAYLERLDRFEKLMATGFSEQFKFTGTPQSERYRTENSRANRKVVHDVSPSELHALRDTAISELAPETGVEDEKGLLPVPVLTVVRVFDLRAHDFITVNANDLTEYVYDESLREKLILPADQRELLDVLTSDLGAFTADMIEGKSAGNVVLAKGLPGVGKTLTAEVYSELVHRPLYSIHSGVLGVTAPEVRKHLEEAFTLTQRWNAVMLLDEADVFVLARGNDIAQNAICAEFLRTLEYFDGLLFLTTNRANDIDDAIISRCAAIIDYKIPEHEDARKIWEVLATGMGVTIPKDVLDDLLYGLPDASPRDMKMLLRLTLRMAASRQSELTTELFGRCAMFRGLHLNVMNKIPAPV